MKVSEIRLKKLYRAKVNNRLATVRVDRISDVIDNNGNVQTQYTVTNLDTGKVVKLVGAAKFVYETVDDSVMSKVEGEQRADPLTGSGRLVSNPVATTLPAPTATVPASTPRSEFRVATDSGPVRIAANSQKEAESVATKDGHKIQRPFAGSLAAELASQFSAARGSSGGSSNSAPHLIVSARAGTGKTTTLVEGIKSMKGFGTKIVPSPQQRAIWDSLALSKDARNICMVAFNKTIASELQSLVPPGVVAMTMHSMGFKAVQSAFGRQALNTYLVQEHAYKLLGIDLDDRKARNLKWDTVSAVERLVSLCKMNLVGQKDIKREYGLAASLVGIDKEELANIADYYDIELNGPTKEIFDLVPEVLLKCLEPRGNITFDDMIWLPVVCNIPLTKYDLLLVDEAQDLNRCQQALAKRAGDRLVLVGDERQAIYGFAGADCDSLPRMTRELEDTPRGCEVLPLTVTRRCGRAVVAEAQRIVPEFEAHEGNPDGLITQGKYPDPPDGPKVEWKDSYASMVKPGDFILCRVNSPLVSQCFRFIRHGVRATIQGRDVGSGLVSTVKKCVGKMPLDKVPVADLITNLDIWNRKEQEKEQAKRNPSESRLIALQDRFDCLFCFTEEAETAQDVVDKISLVFTDSKDEPGVRLSSIHKAKGLEAERVFFLMPKGSGCPHPMARDGWQIEQEYNLLYVGITRAIKELCYVK